MDAGALTRRTILLVGAGVAALGVAVALSSSLLASTVEPGPFGSHPLGDRSVGRPDAPVTMIEYISMTCPQCQVFHRAVVPQLMSTYVARGEMRYVLRDLPLDNAAMAAAMLLRCVPPEQYFAMVERLFAARDEWWTEAKPIPQLRLIALRHGVNVDAFDRCFADKELYKGLIDGRSQAVQSGLSATPTFLINGRKLVGTLVMAQINDIIRPILARR